MITKRDEALKILKKGGRLETTGPSSYLIDDHPITPRIGRGLVNDRLVFRPRDLFNQDTNAGLISGRGLNKAWRY